MPFDVKIPLSSKEQRLLRRTKNIDSIIASFLSGKANDDDLEDLEVWKKESAENKELLDYLQMIWKEKTAEPQFPGWQELSDKIWRESRKI